MNSTNLHLDHMSYFQQTTILTGENFDLSVICFFNTLSSYIFKFFSKVNQFIFCLLKVQHTCEF